MPPAIIDAANSFRAALLQREAAQMAEAARRWIGVEQSLQAAVDALAFQMAESDIITMGQLSRSLRYQALRRQIAEELAKYSDYAEGRIRSGQADMITDAITHSARMINAVATETQIVTPFNRISVGAVNKMIGFAGDGSPLRAVLDDATRGAGDALGQQLISGTALGKNPVEVARQALRLGLGQSFTRIQAIARTEMLRTYRQTSLSSYEASNVVVSYRRLSARDSRVCPACLFADGRTYPMGYGFDAHVNCRCTLVPVLRSVPPVQFQTGQEWFTQQPAATQRQILGAGRYNAWQAGDATLDDMVSRSWSDDWGGSLHPTPVRNLG